MSLSEHFSLATMKHKCSHQQEDQGKCFVTYHLRYYTFLKHEDIADLCSLVCVMTFSFSNFKLESTSLVLFPKDHTHVKCVHPLGYEIVCICMNTTSIIPLSLSSSLKKSQASVIFTLDDGYQQSLSFYSTQREVLAATYYRFLLKNIGRGARTWLYGC